MAVANRLAINKSAIWPTMGYAPHAGQRRVHRSKARHKVVDAGRRAGKSQLGGHELTVEALATYAQVKRLKEAGQRREFWIVGGEYSDSEKEFRVLWNDLARLEVPLDRPGSYNNTETGEMIVKLWGGAFIVKAMSAKYPQTLVGEGLSGVILAEAAKMKPSIWTKYIRPTLADFRGWSIHSSTPEGKNHFYRAYQRGQDPSDTEWDSWKMPSWINDIVFPGGRMDQEILDMAADLTPEKFKQEIEADFTEWVGRVFKDFDEEIHVGDYQYNPNLPLYAAIDYGWTNPFVFLLIQVDVWDNVYVIAEYRRTGMDIEEIAKELPNWHGGLAMRVDEIYPDPGSPADSNVLARHLRTRVAGGTGGELKDRLALIRSWLRLVPEGAPDDQKAPKLYFDRSLTNTGGVFEMNEYRYPESKEDSLKDGYAPELPMKKDDHMPEALGRFFGGKYGAHQQRHATQSTANIG